MWFTTLLMLTLIFFADDESLTYSDDLLLIAIEFENACNPILRTSAQATLQR